MKKNEQVLVEKIARGICNYMWEERNEAQNAFMETSKAQLKNNEDYKKILELSGKWRSEYNKDTKKTLFSSGKKAKQNRLNAITAEAIAIADKYGIEPYTYDFYENQVREIKDVLESKLIAKYPSNLYPYIFDNQLVLAVVLTIKNRDTKSFTTLLTEVKNTLKVK